MKNKKQILTTLLSVLLPVFLVSAVVYATTVGNDVSVGGDLDIVGTDLQTTTGTLNVSKSTSMTTIKGTLNVDEAVTFDTTLGVTGVTTLGSDGVGSDLQLYTDSAGSNLLWDASDKRLEGTGLATVKIGETTTGVNVAGGSTMIYGYGLQKTSALTGDLIGVRGDARLNKDSPSGLVMGGYFMAVNGPEGGTGYTVDTMRGIYTDVFTKAPLASTMTITNARGVEINLGLSAASSTVTNAYGIYLNVTTDKNATQNGFTTGYGLWIQNAAVGGYGGLGTGQMLNAGIYLKGTSFVSVKAFDYGIDMSGATMGTADIKLSSGALIMTGTGAPTAGDCAAGTLGSIYLNKGGGANTSLYVCQVAGGWTAVTP